MNVLVTGATGFIGSHLCEELIKKYEVFGLTQSGNTKKINHLLNHKNFHLIKGDINRIIPIEKIIKNSNIKTVFHLAAFLPVKESFKNDITCIEINVKGTLNLISASIVGGVKNFIYSSTMSVYSTPPKHLPIDENHPTNPSTMYGASKLWGEFICNLHSKKLNVTILRYSGVYGPRQDTFKAIPLFIKNAIENKPIVLFSKGKQMSDFVYVKDVAKANILAIDKPGIFNIGSGQEISIEELAKRIISLCNSQSKIIYSNKESPRSFHFAYDINKARKKIGFSPISLDNGLLEFIRYIKGEKQ